MKTVNEQVNAKDSIQKFISEGREVVMMKENETSFVRIRFNNEDVDGTKKWHILVNGNEFFVSEITIKCPTRTFTEKFEEIGVKHHIVCDAVKITFKNNIANID